MSYINIENVIKSYNKEDNIIKKINLEVKQGEFLVIVGPSGCGKSTLLRMIAGLEDITEGIIKIEDRVINNIPPANRDIAMVFQNYALYPHMNVEQNLSYGLKNRKMPKKEILQRVQEIAKLLQIEEFLKRKPSQLSGGQKQRVAMGRAIIREPKVFLFDEPLSNLDAKLRNQMRIEIRKLHDKLKITSVYVTHDQVEAMTLADRIVVLNDGKIEQIGTPDEIYDSPKTLFVSKFMGTPPMNIFKSEVDNDSIIFCENHIKFDKNIQNSDVYVGIRAEDISINPIKNGVELNIGIDMIERLGSDSLIYATMDTHMIIIKTDKAIEKKLKSIKIYIDTRKIYLFSTTTNQKI